MKNHTTTPPAITAEADIDGGVPDDFPIPDALLDLIDEDEDEALSNEALAAWRFHSACVDRFQACRDLAMQLSGHLRASGQLTASPLTQNHILARYRTALAGSGWTTPEEAYWVMHRVALLLGWNTPTMFIRRLAS